MWATDRVCFSVVGPRKRDGVDLGLGARNSGGGAAPRVGEPLLVDSSEHRIGVATDEQGWRTRREIARRVARQCRSPWTCRERAGLQQVLPVAEVKASEVARAREALRGPDSRWRQHVAQAQRWLGLLVADESCEQSSGRERVGPLESRQQVSDRADGDNSGYVELRGRGEDGLPAL